MAFLRFLAAVVAVACVLGIAPSAQAAGWGFCVSENVEWKKKKGFMFGSAKRIDEFFTPIFATNDTADLRLTEGIWKRYCEGELTWKKKSKRRAYTQDCECFLGTHPETVAERSKRIDMAWSRLGKVSGFGWSVDWSPPRQLLALEQDRGVKALHYYGVDGSGRHALRDGLPKWITGSARSSSASSSGGSGAWRAIGALTGTAILADKGVLDVADAATIANTIAAGALDAAGNTSPSTEGASGSSDVSSALGVLAGTVVAAKEGALDPGDAMVVATTVAAGGDADDAADALEGRLRSRTGGNAGAGDYGDDWDGIYRGGFCWAAVYGEPIAGTARREFNGYAISNVFTPSPNQTCWPETLAATGGSNMDKSWAEYVNTRLNLNASTQCETSRTLKDAEDKQNTLITATFQGEQYATIAVPSAVTSTWRPWRNGLYGPCGSDG